jgi:cytochrome P450
MLSERPSHVSIDQYTEFNFYHPCEAGGDPFMAWKSLQDGPAMQWTPHNGGHWIATRGEDIKSILSDWEQFSSRSAFIPIMPDRPRAVPLEYDPPEHSALKKLLLPAFSPTSIKHWSDQAQSLAVELIEGFKHQGKCEFISDFSQQLPIIIFLRMLNLPMDDRKPLLDAVNATLRPADEQHRSRAREYLNNYISELVKDRTNNPGNDILSNALHTEIDGRLINTEEAHGLASGLLGGGLDTVAASMGWIALFLAKNPVHRQQLIDDNSLIPRATQELLRRFAVPNIARVVKQDMEFNGALLKAGEQVLMSSCMHSMDPQCFESPMVVDFQRSNAIRHLSFSSGIHRCVGSQLALQEIHIFLREWLQRIPVFSIDPVRPPEKSTGIVHGLNSLSLVWPI